MWPLCSRRCWGRGWSGLGVRCKDWNHFEWSNWTFEDCHSLISQMTIYQFSSLENWPSKNDHSAALGEQWSRGIVHHFISSQFEVSWCNISRPFGRLQLCFKHWTLNTSFQTPWSLLHGFQCTVPSCLDWSVVITGLLVLLIVLTWTCLGRSSLDTHMSQLAAGASDQFWQLVQVFPLRSRSALGVVFTPGSNERVVTGPVALWGLSPAPAPGTPQPGHELDMVYGVMVAQLLKINKTLHVTQWTYNIMTQSYHAYTFNLIDWHLTHLGIQPRPEVWSWN